MAHVITCRCCFRGMHELADTPPLAAANAPTKAFSSPSRIADNDYELPVNRYRQVVYEQVEHEQLRKVLAGLKVLEAEIMRRMAELEKILK